ncbi:DUF2203 domain-containing protein [Marinoscillum pacificum]|uniref:DUF2203 domain-containing protein n=1 Tax=Marinoscillum pacificum TaxID=392723 RepID=UPI0021583340|nr:DUF2203 domain-containing protein [Marinoscillum pacificum]
MLSEEITSSIDLLHKELEKLSPAIDLVARANQAVDAAKTIPDLHKNLIAQIQTLETDFRNKLVDELQLSASDISKNVSSLTDSLTERMETIKAFADKLDGQLKENHDFIDQINLIDFPARLNSISGHVSNISSGFNNLQGVTTTLKDDILRIERENNQRINELNESVKFNKTLQFVSVGLLVVVIVLIFVLK